MKTISMLSIVVLASVGSALGASGPVWRLWSPVLSRYFYTISEFEKDLVVSTYPDVWTCEGVGYNAYASADEAGLAPVYRFWSDPLSGHFYTVSESERDFIVRTYPNVWTYEGVAFYAWPVGSQPAGTVPVHRFCSDAPGAYFYTADDVERFAVAHESSGLWSYEGIAWYAYPAESTAPVAIVKGPYLQWPRSDAITVTWETNVATPSRVDYGIVSRTKSLVENPAPVTLHTVELTGLRPDTDYAYRVTSGQAVSAVGNFTTAPSADRSFRFVVYGDSQSYPEAHAEVVRSVIKSAPEIVLRTGDICWAGRHYESWESECFTPAQDLLLTTPMMSVLGNHEYTGTGPLWFFYFFDLPYDAGWFALTYGNTRFIGLDTNVDFAEGSPQHQWLLGELTSAAYNEATWHVVLFHHPPFTATSGHSDDAAVQHHLLPLFESHGVDITFQGHSHTYERYLHHGIYHIVTGGGGGPLYTLTADTAPPVRQFGLSVHHHCVIDVYTEAQTFTVAAVDNTGRVFDTVELHR